MNVRINYSILSRSLIIASAFVLNIISIFTISVNAEEETPKKDTVAAPVKISVPFKNTLELREEITQLVKPVLINLIFAIVDYQTKRIPIFYLRVELPFGWVSSNHRTDFGLADIYVQPLLSVYSNDIVQVPIGVAMVAPSATNRLLGAGKWMVIPIVYPRVSFLDGKWHVALRIRNFFSINGDRDRADVDFLDITPEVKFNITKKWWLYSEVIRFQDNWLKRGVFSARSNLQVGYLITNRIGVSVFPSIYWGPGKSVEYQVRSAAFFKL
jgi:hypothetical protein